MAPSISSRARGFLILTILGAAVVAVVAPGCTSKMKNTLGGGTTPNATINIVTNASTKGMMAFAPDTITVHVNDTVRMHNGDAILHDIEPLSAGNPGWGAIAGGANVDTKVTAAGTFTYVCAVPGHNMVGTLIVAP